MALKKIDAGRVQELWDEGTRDRQRVDMEGFQNLAFLFDEPYVRFDNGLDMILRPPKNDGKVRLNINLIKSLWRGDLGRLMKARPLPEALAASDSDEDIDVAKVANRILTSELERLDWERLRLNILSWVSSVGYCYAHPHWDAKTKSLVVSVVTPGEIVRDPAVRTNINEGQWVIHGRFLTPEEAYEAFGKEFETSSSGSHRTLNLTNVMSGWKFDGVPTNQEGVLVLRMWHLPCRRYPVGLVLTSVNGQEVERNDETGVWRNGEQILPTGGYPFDHGELPFIDFHYYQLPGRFEGQSFIRSLWGPQRDYNHSRSRRAEARVIFAAPGLISPRGALDIEKLTGEAGQVIEYGQVGMNKPEPLLWGSPPNYLFQEEEVAYSEMQEIAHRREVSKGQVPSSGLPATAVQMLQEADETALGPIAVGLERSIARLGKQMLSVIQQYWTTEKAVKVWSEETGSMVIERYKGSDLNGQYDVHVVAGSALPRQKASQRQDLLALWDRRVVQDPRLLVKHMEMPNGDGIMRVLDTDTRHAKREHDRIHKKWSEGMGEFEDPVLPALWHNHDVHIAEHNDERKKESFEKWHPQAQAELADHVAMHEEMRRQKMMEQAAEMAALQPQEPGPNDIPGVNAPEADAPAEPPPAE